MNKQLLGFFALIAVGSAGLVAYRLLLPQLTDDLQVETSDAAATKGKINVAIDSWIGYFPLCGKEMKKQLRASGYVLACTDDKADLAGRFEKLKKGELDLAVATVDSFLTNGAALDFPATIVAVLDESKGGDAVVARKERATSLEQLKANPALKIAFTPASPSEHLLKAVGVHFDIEHLRRKKAPWRTETDGSEAALKLLLDKKVDAAVLWEPDVSRALQADGVVKLLSSKDTARLIVDVLLVRRRFSQDQPEAVKDFLTAYFKALKTYRDDPQRLSDEVTAATKLSPAQTDAMLAGVQLFNLTQNARSWFGVMSGSEAGTEGLFDVIESTARILVENGDFSADPVPGSDPYRLQNRSFIEQLYTSGLPGMASPSERDTVVSPRASLTTAFEEIDEAGWGKLSEVGTLKVRPIAFQSGTAELSDEGKKELDRAAESLGHFPNFRVMIKGHTSLAGDPESNRQLSGARADSVKRYLVEAHGVSAPRLRALGLGASAPLPRQDGESERAYGYRLPRVELYLVSEVY